MLKKLACLFAFVACCGMLKASTTDHSPLQISFWPPEYQIVEEDLNIRGLKVNLPFGSNDEIRGLDIGFASTSKATSGLQWNLILNRVHGDLTGVQLGLINQTENTYGVSFGLLNIASNRLKGVQCGLLNSAMAVHGVQLGLLNYTEFMSGVQIGLVNIILDSKIPVFPFVNLCF